MGPKKKLFLTDLDNTALGGGFVPYDRFPDPFSAFLDVLSENGWDWGINTTWDVYGQLALVNRSAVRSDPAFLIAEFGRRMAVCEGRTLHFVEEYTAPNDERVRKICCTALSSVIRKIFALCPPVSMKYYEHLNEFTFPEGTDAQNIFEKCITREEAEELMYSGSSNQGVIRIRFLHKGLPMKLLSEKYGYSEIVCAGDSLPDLAMADGGCCTCFLAPGNAGDPFKEEVRKINGLVGTKLYAEGIMEAFWQMHRERR